jgi:hypothetical protein
MEMPSTAGAFDNAFATFVEGDPQELDKILTILKEEQAAIDKALKDKTLPSEAFAKLGTGLSYRWNEATGGANGLYPRGRYLELSVTNWDHFGETARMEAVSPVRSIRVLHP